MMINGISQKYITVTVECSLKIKQKVKWLATEFNGFTLLLSFIDVRKVAKKQLSSVWYRVFYMYQSKCDSSNTNDQSRFSYLITIMCCDQAMEFNVLKDEMKQQHCYQLIRTFLSIFFCQSTTKEYILSMYW